MSCILRISGKHLDIDKLINISVLRPYHTYKKGEARFKGMLNGKKNVNSGAAFGVSKADSGKLDKQIRDAIKYLTKNKIAIKKLTNNKQVESACLDFAVELRMGYNKIALQSDTFPHELLKLSGDLKVDIEISLYPPDLDEKPRKSKIIRDSKRTSKAQ